MSEHEIGVNKIYNMDCLEGMKLISDCTVDLVLTDPPYLMNYKTNWRKDKAHDFRTPIINDNNHHLISNYISECYRIMKDDSAILLFCNMNKIDFFKQEIEKHFKLKNIIIWVKNNHTAGDLKAQLGKKYEMIILANKGRKKIEGKRLTDIWEFDRVVGKNQLHQNQKPITLLNQAINMFSNKGDIVFDGFMGSGSTAVACINTNRNFIGFELSDKYYELAKKRIQECAFLISQKGSGIDEEGQRDETVPDVRDQSESDST